MKMQSAAILLSLLFSSSCMQERSTSGDTGDPVTPGSVVLSDPEATPLAAALFENLRSLAGNRVLVGHQDALAYGIGWEGDSFRTDIHDVSGDHPALFGWDLGIGGGTCSCSFLPLNQWASKPTKGGWSGWHGQPDRSGSSWDTDPCLKACLPGGSVHGDFLEKLDQAADFFSGLKTASGEMIPVVFRPFHEMNGDWFWWGATACTPEEYRQLFRFTVDYLRQEKGLHQLVIAYSTDVFTSTEEYLTFYPGDGYVDVMGFDDYGTEPEGETLDIWM
jgi:mannan endo-1,4-beta-mannosidase